MIALTKTGQASSISLKLFLNENMSIRGMGGGWLFAGVSCNPLIFYENVGNADVKWKLSELAGSSGGQRWDQSTFPLIIYEAKRCHIPLGSK